VTAPPFGTDGDPTAQGAAEGGGSLTIHGGTPGNAVVEIALPASGWTRLGNVTHPGYRYRDKRNAYGPISSVLLRNGHLLVRGRGAGLYHLASAPHGSMTVRLEVGARTGFCAVASPRSPVLPNDSTSRFNGVRNVSAPDRCPPLP